MWDTNIRLKRRGFNDTVTCTTQSRNTPFWSGRPDQTPTRCGRTPLTVVTPLYRRLADLVNLADFVQSNSDKIVSARLFGLDNQGHVYIEPFKRRDMT